MKHLPHPLLRLIGRSLALGALALLPAAPTQAADEAPTREAVEFFEKRIRPVLVAKCYECHSAKADSIEGGLVLDTRVGIRRGGDKAPAVVPGDADKSLLLSAIGYADENLQMPPDEKLPDDVIEDFRKWIAMGAPDPREGGTSVPSTIDIEEGRKHWSFQPIADPPVPAVKDESWPRSDIDRFILAGLEAKGLRPVADASPAELRRRIAFDLTGLPPTDNLPSHFPPSLSPSVPPSKGVRKPEQRSDKGGAAEYTEQIDAILASPRFGERWARHWLDVARYAESSGGAHNVQLPLAFRYRNWVIDSLNADKPYDQFIREQIAGDLLPAADDARRREQTIATGFLAIGLKDLRENSQHRFRMAMADEQIDAVGRAFLGLTLACAKCHDHKFDPIPTADYYALAGIFTSSEPMLGARRNRQPDPFASGVIRFADAARNFTDADHAKMMKLGVEGTRKRLALRDEKLRILREKNLSQTRTPKVEAMLAELPSVQKAEREVVEVEAAYDALRARYDAALPQSAIGMRDVKPADCAIHVRGEDTQLGDVVPRGFPQVLTTKATVGVDRSQSGRVQLARWIASPENPLTARVIVNRVWQHLFGTGLVETPDDFGKTGGSPSNPELLDHLAGRLIRNGWSIKRLIREIMTSRIYQLSTAHDERALEIDPANRLHWRMNSRRLDSDALLDAIRATSGDLVYDRPEPVIPPTPRDDRVKSMDHKTWFAPTARHRTIYRPVLREYVPAEWSLFDFPVPELVTGLRGTTTVPTQALYVMNSPFLVEQSQKTAGRLLAGNSEPAAIVAAAYELILNRPPDADERREAAEFLNSFAADAPPAEKAVAAFCQTLFASAEFRCLY